MEVCKKLFEVDTTLTADSVEWCPLEGLEQLLACGTYQLEKDGVRRGSLSLLQWNGTEEKARLVLSEETKQLCDGVLDAKWLPLEGGATTAVALLALAGSSGAVTLLQIGRDCASSHSLHCVGLGGAAEAVWSWREGSKGLCLSLDWSTQQSPAVLAVSDSLGGVSLLELTASGLRYLRGWKAHDFEAWIVGFGGPSTPHTVFSGGDDCRLHVWDTRTDCAKPTFTSKRCEMGVCSLQRHPTEEHILASGSYDESLLLWDTRSMARPLKELSLGGGVWRIKWHPRRADLIAAACTHGGCCVLDAQSTSGWDMELWSCYKEHGSLAYGVDWSRLEVPAKDRTVGGGENTTKHTLENDYSQDCSKLSENDYLLASCSFYDHSLHFWTTHL